MTGDGATAPPAATPVTAALLATHAPLWERIGNHPFVAAAGEGTLPAADFDRWIVADHHFVVGFRRFLAALLAGAPDEAARDVLAGGLAALTPELDLFRAAAAEHGLDLDAEPGPVTLGYTGWLVAAALEPWPVALAVLWGAERAYHDAWAAVRARAAAGSPYRSWIDNWSGPAFAAYVDALGGLLDREVLGAPARAAVERAFGRVVRFELAFWDAVAAGDGW